MTRKRAVEKEHLIKVKIIAIRIIIAVLGVALEIVLMLEILNNNRITNPSPRKTRKYASFVTRTTM